MSGKPSPMGAKELLAMMEKVDPMLHEVEEAKKQVAALRGAEERLEKATIALTETTRAIGKALEDMDCSSVGNWGFEGRMGWLMLELRRRIVAGCQAKAHPPAAPPPETVD